MSSSARVDVALVNRGLVRSRAQAREQIDAGNVTIDGDIVRKPSVRVSAEQVIAVTGERDPWVGRAAYKLLAALEAFGPRGLDVAGARCVDVGASTGGFTQVLLHCGAAHVVALDVGRDQLAREIASDPRVQEISGTSVRGVTSAQVAPGDVVVADLSFISLSLVMADIAALTRPSGHVVVLVKPQFEVGREALARDGVVRSGELRARAVEGVLTAARTSDLSPHGLLVSPVVGGTGNQEYLLWLRFGEAGMMTAMDLTQQLAQISGRSGR
ncbi:hypothetical protein VV02_13780 [Luteipulveratus mongoliensis]|uniref:RNA-binding S4 domain-containing protein n=1 Tax=Luteipulveratus mongoliensis TaxID=571913 RepID=A0A0K1JQB6_9MICO|nr:hypothetical protein VV02_13780 [Luteipulveratus mongoliensis]